VREFGCSFLKWGQEGAILEGRAHTIREAEVGRRRLLKSAAELAIGRTSTHPSTLVSVRYVAVECAMSGCLLMAHRALSMAPCEFDRDLLL